MAKIIDVLDEILKFSPKIMVLNQGIDETSIDAFEKRRNVALPNDYKTFLKRTNGLDVMGNTVFGIYDESVPQSLDKVYIFEHFEVGNEMPLYLVPFSPDGAGNHYCFDSRKLSEESCEIVFWQHDYSYDADDTPEVVYASFADFAKEVLVEWTLEKL